MQTYDLSPNVRDELLSLCQKEQAIALRDGRDDVPDCGCLAQPSDRTRSRLFPWL